MRDFKKEATSFVPSALKRKKAGTGTASKVDAAPSVGPSESDDKDAVPVAARPDLLSTLRTQLGAMPVAKPEPKVQEKPKDDYAKFLDGMADVLGPGA